MNAADILKYGHSFLMNALKDIPEAETTTPGACGTWSVKDIVAHFASLEHVLVEVLSLFLEPGPTPYMQKYGQQGPAFNDLEVEARRDKSYAEVLQEYTDTCSKTMELAARIPPETLRQVGAIPWYGPEYSLDDFIVYTYYGHKREHGGQILIFKDRFITP